MEEFGLVFDPATKVVTCKFEGRMDTVRSNGAMEFFRKEFDNLLSSGVRAEELKIRFDLSGVDYISSSFLRLCVGSAKDIKKGNFSIVNTGPEIMKVFKIAGIDGLLNVS
ncbi:MAG: STAS domain-containing protein [Nitrospirae bacterium]|nr:STAS domain-containing protein [Nitrospirota bacterium]